MDTELKAKLDKTFSDDCFGRKILAEKLLKIIDYNCPFRDDSFVISLNAPFGRGKTTFIKMFENFLLETGDIVISLNAWETDFAKDPLVPISCSIMESIKSNISDVDEEFKKKAINVIKATLNIASGISKFVPGANEFLEAAKNIKDTVSCDDTDKDDQFFRTKNQYEELKNLLSEFVEKTNKKRLVIIVDELDRCRPNYAIEFLETVKHIFAVKGITFILAVNKEQIRISAESLFGRIDFDNYYLRFVSKEIELTEAKIDDYHKFNQLLFQRYKENKPPNLKDLFKKTSMESSSNSLFQDNRNPTALDQLLEWNTKIFANFKFEPRQIERFYKDFSYFIYREKDWPNERDTSLSFTKGLSFLIALRIKNEKLFNLLINNYEKFHLELITELKKYGLCGNVLDHEKNVQPYLPYHLGLEIFSFCRNEKNFTQIKQLAVENFSNNNDENSRKKAENLFIDFKNNYRNPSFNNLASRLFELKTIEED